MGSAAGVLKTAAARTGLTVEDYRGYEPEHHLDVEVVCTLCHADREKRRRG